MFERKIKEHKPAPKRADAVAFQNGYAAYKNGVTKNPYRFKSVDYDDWFHGFRAAEFDDPNIVV